MSILIKGIDMPKEGEHIVALIKSNGKCSYWKQDTEYGICEPMQTVEAIQIDRPHGRLIDGDKLKDTLKEYCIDDDEKVAEWYRIMGIDEAIDDNAPTILEAEE